MANGIQRKQVLGIAKQTTFGTPAVSATYWLPANDFDGGEAISVIKNEAMTGSIYKSNDAIQGYRQAKPSFEIKVSEAEFPLLLLSFGTLSTSTVVGETVVYEHTITFTNSNTKQLYTLFLDDPDRGDLVYDSFRIESIEVTFTKDGFILAKISGLSRYPTTSSFSLSLTEWLEFVGRNCEFKMADEGGSLSVVKLLEATLTHNFGISGDDDNMNLGNQNGDLEQSFNLESEFKHSVKLHFPDYTTYKDKWKAGTRQAFSANITDTNRVVSGSVTSVNPSILFTYPSAILNEWKKDGGAGDLLKQDFSIEPIDRVAVSDTPVKIVVRNGVATY